MIKAANLCMAFFPTGTGGSNLQRTVGLKDPLPRALGEPDARIVLNTGFTYLGESPKRGGICCVSGKWSRGAPAFRQPGRRPASIYCSKTCRIVPVNSTRQPHTSRLLLDPLHG